MKSHVCPSETNTIWQKKLKPQDFMVQMGTTMTSITVQAAAAINAPILHALALRNSASLRLSSES